MTAEIGHYALILSLVVAAVCGILPLLGAHFSIRSWMRTGFSGALILAATSLLSIGALSYAFLTSDFSLINVARNSNSALPWFYKLAAVWGSHEGSILFWVTTLCLWGGAVALSLRKLPEKVQARILGTLNLVSFGLFLFILMTSNPFLRLFPPAINGADLNPLLQDPGMIFHPPLLYLGYVGFAVPFAFAIAALLGGRLDVAWARWMRPWTTSSWVLLTLGIALGSYWSYYELGWGGWWAWDPVENASFMPWLTGTALMHSIAATEKRGVFKIWTVFLAILTFALSLLGTFLVRSGVLTSVHAFAADPTRGIFILVFLMLVVGASFLVFACRGSRVKSIATFDIVSKEAGILANNALLLVGMGTVLLGTLYPLAIDALGLGKISVGAPYFNSVFGASVIPVAMLVTPGILARWKSDNFARFGRTLGILAAISVLLGLAFTLLLGNVYWQVVTGISLAIWICLGTLWNIFERLSSLKKMGRATKAPLSWWGMHIAHIGLAVTMIGAISVSFYEVERDVTMQVGDVVTVRDVTLRWEGWTEYRGPNYTAAKGEISVLDAKGNVVDALYPEKRNYDSVTNMTMTEASIIHRPIEDIYVSMGSPALNGKAWSIRAYVKPLVMWIWYGSLLMSLGGILAIYSKKKKEAK